MKQFYILGLLALITACSGAATPAVSPFTPVPRPPTLISTTGYRPLQVGDVIEDAPIIYQYVLPSIDQPTITVAFGSNLMQLVSVNSEMSEGLVEYVREIAKSSGPVLAYDETTPNQTEPKPLTFDSSKPVEIAFIQLLSGVHYWSVTETDDQGVQAAYKIVRRKDGGLRFIDAYGLVALYSANSILTINGGGTGLVFSSRVALLKLILSDQKYQKGTNVFVTNPVDYPVFDSRILKLDPNRSGLEQNRDWLLISRPMPVPGGIPGP